MEDSVPVPDKSRFDGFHKVKFADSSTAKWLGTVASSLPPKPSTELTCFFSTCDITGQEIIILEAIFTIFGQERCGEWVRLRKNEVLNLYYRVLLAICEAQKLTDLSSLLTNEAFHRSMLAISAELILAAHNVATILFISIVLERTGITGFDLCKVIESFVRYEKFLPKRLRRHLNSLEERLLESVVWEKGSSLYNSLAVVKPTMSREIHRLWLFAEPMPTLVSIASCIHMPSRSSPATTSPSNENDYSPDRNKRKRVCTEYRGVLVERNLFTTPIKKHRLTPRNYFQKLLQSASQFAHNSEFSPTTPNPSVGGGSRSEVEIDMFFTKVLKLAAVRIKRMVERLKLSEEMRERIYCLFSLALCRGTSLFFNRHVDHIILCCFYMVAKVQEKLTFRELIVIYRKQQQYRHDIYCRVFVDRSGDCYSGKIGHEHVGLKEFYNEIFLHAIKLLLKEISPVKTEESPPLQVLIQSLRSPNKSPFLNLPDHSPRKVSAKHNVYVSPLRSPEMKNFISNSCKSSYAFFGESTHQFQSPSKDLRVINDRLNCRRNPKGKLNFDDMDHGVFISDSTVVGCLFPVE